MSCLSCDNNFKTVKCSHHGARLNGEMSEWNIRKIMQTKNAVSRELFKQAIIYHLLGASPTFLSRLKNEIDYAIKVTMLC